MTHDVFVSYSKEDKPVADAVVAGLENSGIRCWVAPRDITPGFSWSQAIVESIEESHVMVIIFSVNSNRSKQVEREVERAVATNAIIIPFRIENIDPTSAMAYYLSKVHWLDAITPPLEEHINKLGNKIRFILTREEQEGVEELTSQPQINPALVLRRQHGLTDDQKTVLQSFSRALQREMHVLTMHPNIFWQQMYNRLQWEGVEVKQAIAPELDNRSRIGGIPWLRLNTPIHESVALVRTLEGHTSTVLACAFSPDGRFILSSCKDGTLRVWDAATGQVQSIMECGKGEIGLCGFSQDGRFVLNKGFHMVQGWEATTGEEQYPIDALHQKYIQEYAFSSTHSPDGNLVITAYRRTTEEAKDARVAYVSDNDTHQWLRGHERSILSLSFSPDGCFIVTASMDNTLRVWDTLTGSMLHILEGHNGWVTACSFSPDGQFIVSASADMTLRIWDSNTGELLRTLEGHSDYIEACAYSPDGRFIVSASRDRTLRVWDLSAPDVKQSPYIHTDQINACEYSPDGDRIVSSSDDGTLRVWNAANGETINILESQAGAVQACAISPDGTRILSAAYRYMQLWNSASGRLLFTIEDRIKRNSEWWEISACAFSPDGHFIAFASGAKVIGVCNAITGDLLHTLEGHPEWINVCMFSPDGNFIVSASKDKTLRIWDTSTGNLLHILEGHSASVNACAVSPDARTIVSASDDTTIRMWDTTTGHLLHTFIGHTRGVYKCAFSPDGRFVVSISWDRTLRVWDASSGGMLAYLLLPGDLKAMDLHPWAQRAVCGDAGGALYQIEMIGIKYGLIIVTAIRGEQEYELICPICRKSFQVEEGDLGSEITCPQKDCSTRIKVNSFVIDQPKVLNPNLWYLDISSDRPLLDLLKGFRSPVDSCSFSPDGRLIAFASWDNTVRVWDAITGELRNTLVGHTDIVKACAFSSDGHLIVSGGEDKMLRVWDVDSGQLLSTLVGHSERILACVFSPEGNIIVSTGEDKTLRFWDTTAGNSLITLEGHTGWVNACAISPDGRYILSASDDNTVRMWDVASRSLLHTFSGHSHYVYACAFSPDGRLIISSGFDKTVCVRDVSSGQLIYKLYGHSGSVNACAFSPDGNFIISASADKTVQVWNLENRKSIACDTLPDVLESLGVHPWLPKVVCGDYFGNVYPLKIGGFKYGPIIVTAFDRGLGLVVRCPSCQCNHPITQTHLGNELTCPTLSCGLGLKINPFVIQKTDLTR